MQLFDYTSVAFAQDASAEDAARLERLEAQSESAQKGQSERDDRDAKDRETRDAEKRDNAGQQNQNGGSGYPPQARKVIMVYPRGNKQLLQKQSWSDMSSQVNGGTTHDTVVDGVDSEAVVIDLDAVTFYDFDEESAANHSNTGAGNTGAAPTLRL